MDDQAAAAARVTQWLDQHGHGNAASTKNDDLDDPKHHQPDVKVDPKWKQTPDGGWYDSKETS